MNIGFVRVGRRASYLIGKEDFGDARIVSIADCWEQQLGEAVKVHPQGASWSKYTEYRKMFEKEKLNAVSSKP